MDVKFPLLVVGCAERHVQLGDYMSRSRGFSVGRSIQENYRELASHSQGHVSTRHTYAIVIWVIMKVSLIVVYMGVLESSSCWLLADAGG